MQWRKPLPLGRQVVLWRIVSYQLNVPQQAKLREQKIQTAGQKKRPYSRLVSALLLQGADEDQRLDA
jgi:hypothetical protein